MPGDRTPLLWFSTNGVWDPAAGRGLPWNPAQPMPFDVLAQWGGGLAQAGGGGRRSLGRGHVVPVVVIIFLILRAVVLVVVIVLILRAVVFAWELNGSNVTAARPHPGDIYPALPQLVSEGTDRIVPGINRLTGRQ